MVAACADPARPDGWIDGRISAAYTRLHRLGWAHSVEAWHDGELVGGLYGVAIGGLFAGESMFHPRARRLEGRRWSRWSTCCATSTSTERLLDVQWAHRRTSRRWAWWR